MSWIQNRKKPIQVETVQTLTKTQGTILGRSFGYAALGFVIMAALIAGLTCAWQFGVFNDGNWYWNNPAYQGLNIGLTIGSFVLTITSAILSMFWQGKMMTNQKATGMTFLVWGFFIVGQAMAFSWLMFMLNNSIYRNPQGNVISLWWVCPAAFGLAVVLFGLMSIIGYSLSNKGQLTVKKMMLAVGLAFGIMMLPMFILMLMSIWMPWGAGTMFWLCFVMMILFLFLLLLSILSIIGDIKRCDQFAQLNIPSEQQGTIVKNLSLMFGFSLLVEFVCLVWLLIWLILSIMGLSRRF